MNISKQAKLEKRVIETAKYIIKNKSTVRETAKHIGVSKSTTYKDLSERLPGINKALHGEVANVLEINKRERHMRGGIATREMYARMGDSK